MSYIPFNINHHVKVKLTDVGREIHKESFYADGLDKFLKYIPPQEDDEGWHEIQLWALMQLYGPHLINGLPNPFKMIILIPESQREDVYG